MKTIKMKSVLAGISLALVFLTSCSRVAPNHEGVLMTHYGRSGMSDFKIVTGKVSTIGPGTELYQVPMYEQKADPKELGVTSKDGGYFSIDPTYSYEAIRGKGVEIIFNYKHVGAGSTFMDNVETNILDPLVLNAYREEARNYSTDSLMNNLNLFENVVQARLTIEFEKKYFKLNTLTSGLKPPKEMIDAIIARNNVKIQTEKVEAELEMAKMNLEKAKIQTEIDQVKSTGFTKEILMSQWIEAIRNSPNAKIIITDGKTVPFIMQ